MTYPVKFIVLLLFAINNDNISAQKCQQQNAKIVGGQPVNIEDYPYMAFLHVNIKNKETIACGGSILSRQYILTAAHCLIGGTGGSARIGSTYAKTGNKGRTYRFNSKHLAINEKYNPEIHFKYDIGLINIPEGMNFRGISAKPVRLVERKWMIEPGTEVKVAGWGYTSQGSKISNRLMGLTIYTISNQKCSGIYRTYIPSVIFCAGVKDGVRGTYKGDSGSPLVADGVQIGLVCGRRKAYVGSESPAMYANFTNTELRQWVKKHAGV